MPSGAAAARRSAAGASGVALTPASLSRHRPPAGVHSLAGAQAAAASAASALAAGSATRGTNQL